MMMMMMIFDDPKTKFRKLETKYLIVSEYSFYMRDIVVCSDKSLSCPEYKSFCRQPGATINSMPLREYCPKTCELC